MGFSFVYIYNTVALDDLSQDFLKSLLENGGDADTSTIRSETGMSRGQVNHRFRKLEDLGWIEINREQTGRGERTPPKVGVLTEKGKQAIRSGDAGGKILGQEPSDDDDSDSIEVTRETVQEIYDEIDAVKNQLNAVVERVGSEDDEEETEKSVDDDRFEELEREVERLRDTVEMLNNMMSNRDDTSGSSGTMDNELRSQQEYLENWIDVAEKHMTGMEEHIQAMELAVIEETDIDDFDAYLERVEGGN